MDRVIGAGRDNDRRQEGRICNMKKMGKSKREGEGECVWGDSLGLLQKRRRLTACDDWRLSVEKNKGRDKIQREKEHVGDMKYVGSGMDVDG